MKKNIQFTRSILFFTLKVAVGVVAVVWLHHNDTLNFASVSGRDWFLIGLLVICNAVITLGTTLRWYIIFRSLCHDRLAFLRAFFVNWSGVFISTFTPMPITSDLTRYYYFKGKGLDAGLISSMVMDRYFSVLGLACLVVPSMLALQFSLTIVVWFFLVVVMFFFLLFGHGLIIRFFQILAIRKPWFQSAVNLPIRHQASAIGLGVFAFLLKSIGFMAGFAIVTGAMRQEDMFFSQLGPAIDIISVTPGNFGVGHIVYEKILAIKSRADGANIFHVYFLGKILFQLMGCIPWFFQKRGV